MSELNEEEIIKYIKDEIENETDTYHWFNDMPDNKTRKQIEESINAHQGLLDLYQTEKIGNANLQMLLDEEKEKNKKVIEMLQEHIKICGQEAIGHFNNKALKFDKQILQELLEERN